MSYYFRVMKAYEPLVHSLAKDKARQEGQLLFLSSQLIIHAWVMDVCAIKPKRVIMPCALWAQ